MQRERQGGKGWNRMDEWRAWRERKGERSEGAHMIGEGEDVEWGWGRVCERGGARKERREGRTSYFVLGTVSILKRP